MGNVYGIIRRMVGSVKKSNKVTSKSTPSRPTRGSVLARKSSAGKDVKASVKPRRGLKLLSKKPAPTKPKAFQAITPSSSAYPAKPTQEKKARFFPRLELWQSPVVEFWEDRLPNRLKKPPKLSKTRRLERRILIMLAFFSISVGLWENFRQLWLQDNGFIADDVSNIISIGTIVSAVGALLISKFVRMSRLKHFMTITLAVRCVVFVMLAILNHTGLTFLIDIFSILEIFTGSLFLVSIYPLLTLIIKNNSIYSRRKLVEYLFRDIGILIGGIFIGQQMGNFLFDYNACLLLATAFLVVATMIMWRIDLVVTESAPEQRSSIKKTIKAIMKDKIQKPYMVYVFLSECSFAAAMGLKMLMLTDDFGFSAGIATNYMLVVGLIADFLGIMALKYFTPKNDYITITLKFGIRFIIFSLAAIAGNNFLSFIAFTWAILSSTAYENVTDGYYVNAIDNRHQFKYNTVRHVVQYFGVALGTFICGQMFQYGPAAVFGVAGFIVVLQLGAAYYLIYVRQGKKIMRQNREK